MARKLRNLKIREISFVDKGASGDGVHTPRVAFWKRNADRSSDVTKQEVAKRLVQVVELSKMQLPEGAQALLETIQDQLSEEQWALMELMLANAAEMPPMETGPRDDDKPADQPEPAEKSDDEEEDDEEDPKAEEPKQEEEGQPMPEKKPEELMAKIRKENPEVASVLESLEKRAKDAEAKAVAAEKMATEELQKRRLERFEKTAETDLKHLQGTPAELAKQLADIEDALGPEAFAKHLTMLKAASENVAKTFKPSGASGSQSGSAYEAIKAKARELIKSDVKLTEAQAMAKVMKSAEHRELVKRYRAEQVG